MRSFFFNKAIKIFKCAFFSKSGRNYRGRICVQHQGGPKKNLYLRIDRFRYVNKFGFIFRILSHFFFNGFIGLVVYSNGLLSFILLAEGVQKNSLIFSGSKKIRAFLGCTQKVLNIRLFDPINSVEKFPFSGAKLTRSAGTSAYLFSKAIEKSILKLPSG
jgi:ribosomal protein L2